MRVAIYILKPIVVDGNENLRSKPFYFIMVETENGTYRLT